MKKSDKQGSKQLISAFVFSTRIVKHLFHKKKFQASRSLLSFQNPAYEEVQVGKDQEKAQSEKDSHSKNRGGKKPN